MYRVKWARRGSYLTAYERADASTHASPSSSLSLCFVKAFTRHSHTHTNPQNRNQVEGKATQKLQEGGERVCVGVRALKTTPQSTKHCLYVYFLALTHTSLHPFSTARESEKMKKSQGNVGRELSETRKRCRTDLNFRERTRYSLLMCTQLKTETTTNTQMHFTQAERQARSIPTRE